MSWTPKNTFSLALSGITLLGVAGLFYYGKTGRDRYQAAKSNFDQAVAAASAMERSVPYPTAENRNAKSKAIDDFRKDVSALQEAYSAYRPGELKMVSPEQFIDRLKLVRKETSDELERNAVVFPDSYFVGFKDYTSKYPNKSATGVLGYQLEAIRELMLELAKSGATELRNLHRPDLEEESGIVFQAPAEMVARPLPLEITFKGPERSLRKFVSALAKSDSRYWVVRSLRVTNMKKEPPKTADAKFNAPAARNPAQPAFDDFLRFNEEEPAAGAEGEAPVAPAPQADPTAPDAAAPAPAPAAPAGPVAGDANPEGNRNLALILGNEELVVHLRLDLMMFLESKPLP